MREVRRSANRIDVRPELERSAGLRLTTGLPTCTASQMFRRPWPSLPPDVRPCGWKDVPTTTTMETAGSRSALSAQDHRIGYDVKGDRQPWLALCVR
jgi:hypothetical protein